MCDETDSLISYWEAIKPPEREASDLQTPQDISLVSSWAEDLGSPGKTPVLTIPGQSPTAVLTQLGKDPAGRYISTRAGSDVPRLFVRGLLRELMLSTELSVEGPLREMADRAHTLPFEVYGLLWDGRFMLRECMDAGFGENAAVFGDFLDQMSRWATGSPDEPWKLLPTLQARMGVLCFLLALAAQNNLFKRAIVLFDGIASLDDRAMAKELALTIAEARRWAFTIGCPLGILLGYAASRNDIAKLRKLNQDLAMEVEVGLAWTKTLKGNAP